MQCIVAISCDYWFSSQGWQGTFMSHMSAWGTVHKGAVQIHSCAYVVFHYPKALEASHIYIQTGSKSLIGQTEQQSGNMADLPGPTSHASCPVFSIASCSPNMAFFSPYTMRSSKIHDCAGRCVERQHNDMRCGQVSFDMSSSRLLQ